MSKVTLKVGGNASIDASASTETDAYQIDRSYEWSIIMTKTGTDGDPQIEIEGSNDGTTWKNPYIDPDNVPNPLVKTLDEATNSIFDEVFPFEYFRVKTIPNGTTTGTLSYVMSIFKDE